MISRLSSGPPGRRHSLFTPHDPQMGTRSHVELPGLTETEDDLKSGATDRSQQQSATNPDLIVDNSSTSYLDQVACSSSKSDEDDVMTLNVGGRVFRTYRRTLMRLPGTRLGLLACSTTCCSGQEDIFFDRNPDMFEAILNLYRDDALHTPRHVCVIAFCKELEFWGFNETWLSDCCQKQYNDTVGEMQLAEMMKTEFQKIRPRRVVSDVAFIRTKRGRLWEFLDNPESSKYAKIWFLCFYVFILISVVNVFISTHPSCRVTINNPYFDLHNHPNATPEAHDFLMHQAENNPKIRRMLTSRPHDALIALEVLCAIYFSFEFSLRFAVCPHKRLLFRNKLTWCDLIYLIPLWCQLFISSAEVQLWNEPRMLPGTLFLKLLMVLRVLRIFTLAKHYRALRILLLSIKASMKEVLLLFTFVVFSMIIYSCLVYCAEVFTEDSHFDTLPTGLWWALITMTTVGYGDMVPKSWAGYIVGAACALTGIIIIGMPVPIITSNFHLYYGFQQPMEEDEEIEVVTASQAMKGKPLTSRTGKGKG